MPIPWSIDLTPYHHAPQHLGMLRTTTNKRRKQFDIIRMYVDRRVPVIYLEIDTVCAEHHILDTSDVVVHTRPYIFAERKPQRLQCSTEASYLKSLNGKFFYRFMHLPPYLLKYEILESRLLERTPRRTFLLVVTCKFLLSLTEHLGKFYRLLHGTRHG